MFNVSNSIYELKVILKKIPETLRYLCCKEKILINSWIVLKNGKLQHRNFGDELNYHLVTSLTGKRVYNSSDILLSNKNIMVIGSIIESKTDKDSIIWGSGAMFGDCNKRLPKPKKVLAVRGPLTRDYLLSQGIDCPEVYGDPALLFPYIYTPIVEKRYKLGVIPHNHDIDCEYLNKLRDDMHVKIISLKNYDDWKQVITDICSCDFIVSSSLHGLIISDAYKIPNCWIKLTNKVEGGNFKFHDYFMSVGREVCDPIVVNKQITKEEVLKFKECYKLIDWDPQPLLQVAPFKIQNPIRNN